MPSGCHRIQFRSCQYEIGSLNRPALHCFSSPALQTGKAITSASTMPKSHARSWSVGPWDIASSVFVFARLSTRSPQRSHTRSGMRTRLRFTSFQSFVSIAPRSSSAIRWPSRSRSSATRRLPMAPRAIFRKKLESGLSATAKTRRDAKRSCQAEATSRRFRPSLPKLPGSS